MKNSAMIDKLEDGLCCLVIALIGKLFSVSNQVADLFGGHLV